VKLWIMMRSFVETAEQVRSVLMHGTNKR